MEEISPVCAGEDCITRSLASSKEKSALPQTLNVVLQIRYLEMNSCHEKRLCLSQAGVITKFLFHFGMSLHYSFSSVFYSFEVCRWGWLTWLPCCWAWECIPEETEPDENHQARNFITWNSRDGDPSEWKNIKTAYKCGAIQPSLCSDFKQRYGLQTMCSDSALEPHGSTYISVINLPGVTTLGKAENHHFHCCMLRPA